VAAKQNDKERQIAAQLQLFQLNKLITLFRKCCLRNESFTLSPSSPFSLYYNKTTYSKGKKLQLKTERRRKSQMLHQIIIKVGLTFCIANSKGQ